MTLVAFFLGLAIGIGCWLYWRAGLYQQLEQLLRSLPAGASDLSLPLISRLRRGINLAKGHQQDLENELETWQQILEVAPLGYLIVDEENQLLWCNEQARQLLNIQRWESGQVRLLLEWVRSYELDQLIEQTRFQQQPMQQEWEFHPSYQDAEAIGKSASNMLRASTWPLPGEQVGVFLENRQALVELSQARDRGISDLAHELRTPLTSIRLVAETLQSRLEPPLSRLVDRLLPEINRLINLVQDWLELSQLEIDPSKKLNRKPLELKSLIESVWQTLEPLARSKELTLEYSGPDALWIEADESRLYRVFLNLLDNSIKYSPPQGMIHAEINLIPGRDDLSRQVQVNIVDSGSGFPESDLPHVFERLYRGDPSRTRQSSALNPVGVPIANDRVGISSTTGTGLGLAIARQIILAHGGVITASNCPTTGGALLKIELPYC
jgi:two-component system, OmpR family, phosphate regulon sensor histidine kinase PhoR